MDIKKYDWYPQMPGLQLEKTDWRLQEQNLPIWDKSWQCTIKRDRKCAIDHLKLFLEKDLEQYQIDQVHSAMAQHYLTTVTIAHSRSDLATLRAVQEDIDKLNKSIKIVKILNHQVAQAYHRVGDWDSCVKHGEFLMNSVDTRVLVTNNTNFPMLLGECLLRSGDRAKARYRVETYLKESGKTRKSLAPSYERLFRELDPDFPFLHQI